MFLVPEKSPRARACWRDIKAGCSPRGRWVEQLLERLFPVYSLQEVLGNVVIKRHPSRLCLRCPPPPPGPVCRVTLSLHLQSVIKMAQVIWSLCCVPAALFPSSSSALWLQGLLCRSSWLSQPVCGSQGRSWGGHRVSKGTFTPPRPACTPRICLPAAREARGRVCLPSAQVLPDDMAFLCRS